MAYYNEIDPYCAQWLRNLIAEGLIAAGDVDERSIKDVKADDLSGYAQCHFFAGLGGWSYALRLAGWSDDEPVWTGSCPCQPFSVSGQRQGFADDRDLWPAWFDLIRQRRPAIVFGEQVAGAKVWLDRSHADVEGIGYAFGAAVLPACAVDAQHRRERLWFVADHGYQEGAWAPRRQAMEWQAGRSLARRDGKIWPLADASEPGLSLPECEIVCGARWGDEGRATSEFSRWPAEPDVGRVAHGIPGRVGQLRAIGNAIVPQVAAEFIAAARGCLS